jgi:hypothetical protein
MQNKRDQEGMSQDDIELKTRSRWDEDMDAVNVPGNLSELKDPSTWALPNRKPSQPSPPYHTHLTEYQQW